MANKKCNRISNHTNPFFFNKNSPSPTAEEDRIPKATRCLPRHSLEIANKVVIGNTSQLRAGQVVDRRADPTKKRADKARATWETKKRAARHLLAVKCGGGRGGE